jgi:hypothetical protein
MTHYTKVGSRYKPVDGLLTKEQAWGRSGLMAIAAFRYCLGRRTYISGDCADWLVFMWNDFPPNIQSIIKRDLEEEFKRDDEARANGEQYKPLGDDCDRNEWERVRALYKNYTEQHLELVSCINSSEKCTGGGERVEKSAGIEHDWSEP